MSNTVATKTKRSQKVAKKQPHCLKIARRGIKTGADFAIMMSALMSDLVEGRVAPEVGNATCNAGGKLLKVVEMQYKYGTAGPGTGQKVLTLAAETSDE